MLVKDVDIKVIEKLLNSIPDHMCIDSISLINGYELVLRAGTEQIKGYEKEQVLNELKSIIERLEKQEKALLLK